MNKYLRQLFTAVIALFVVLGMSTTIITAIRANSLSSDPRNARALYQDTALPEAPYSRPTGRSSRSRPRSTTCSHTSVPTRTGRCTPR